MTNVNKWFGCRRDLRDARDHEFEFSKWTRTPSSVDLRAHCPPPMDQGALGSCVANAVTGVLRHAMLVRGQSDVHLSRLQSYFDARRLEGTVSSDSGVEIRDGIKCAAKHGVAHEKLWPYKVSKFRDKPTAKVYTDALSFTALEYERVAVSVTALRHALARGFPVVIGMALYSSFESDAVSNTGMVPMPDLDHEKMLGGHAMYVCGYSQRTGHFTVRNSWGSTWGQAGDCFVPYAYLGSVKYASDFWIVKTEGAANQS